MSHDFPYRQTTRLPGYDYSSNGLYFVTICTYNRENLFGDIVGAKPCFRPTHAQNCPINPNVSNTNNVPNVPNTPNVSNAPNISNTSNVPNVLNINNIPNVQAIPIWRKPIIIPDCNSTAKSGENTVSPLQIIPTIPKFEPNISGTMIEKWWLKLFEKFPELKLHQYILMPNHFHGIIEICDEQIPLNDKKKSGILENVTNCQNENPSDIQSGENMVSPLQGLGRYISWFKRMTTNEYIRMVKEKILPPFYGKIWQRNYHEHIIRNEKSYQIIAEYITTNPINWESDTLYKS